MTMSRAVHDQGDEASENSAGGGSALLGDIAHGQDEQGHDPQAHKKRQEEASFSFPVVFELRGECGIVEILILPARNELSKSASSGTLKIAGLGTTKRHVGLGVPRSERFRKLPPSPYQSHE
ncbi:MAG: hypothetical protein OEW06_15890 [Gemmatimonadota bacterium]|nr:hypothetical protein [Gemmatimonadota bacterium]MDH4350997.1 hypothetical protein [Gemmatimonadota bacterium]